MHARVKEGKAVSQIGRHPPASNSDASTFSMQRCGQPSVVTGKPAPGRAQLTVPTISVVSAPRVSFSLAGGACLA